MVLAGSGPLLYLVASHLIRKGHPLAAVLDQTPPSNMLKAAPHLPAGLLGLPLAAPGPVHAQRRAEERDARVP